MGPETAAHELQVDGRQLTVRDPDRIIFPATGTTRAELLRYYAAVADTMLPHLQDRVLHMPRYPEGVDGPCWSKPCPRLRPQWLPTTQVWDAERGDTVEYCVVDQRAALMWAIAVGSIELLTPLHRCGAVYRPTAMAFALEPCEGVCLLDCCEAALALRDLVAAERLVSYVKTSGVKGLHVYVPLNTHTDYAATRARARDVAARLQAQMPDAVIAASADPPRRHKVLADYRANSELETLVCPYSVRARERPTVSAPVTWDEVQGALDAGDDRLVTFEMAQVIERISERGNPFAPVLHERQELVSELQAA